MGRPHAEVRSVIVDARRASDAHDPCDAPIARSRLTPP